MSNAKQRYANETPARINPHIVVRDAATAAEWYARAFGAQEGERIPVPGGKFMSIELRFGETTMMMADEFPEMGVLSPLSIGGTAVVLTISTAAADSLWERAVAAGAEIIQPLSDAFWGERHGLLLDPFGHRWGIAQRMRHVPHDEIVRVAAELFSGHA